jgi:hypothetical protein
MDDRYSPGRRTAHAPESWMPISRATVQVWGLEQLTRSFHEDRPRRRPLRVAAQWIATAITRTYV